MQITETSADGLKREYKVVISAQDIEEKVNGRLEELSRTAQLPGFRPGKVPVKVIRQRYGDGVLAEVLEDLLSNSPRDVINERGLRVAMRPQFDVTRKYEKGGDLEYTMSLELLPDIEPGDVAAIELERPVAEVEETAVDEALKRLASARATTTEVTEERPAAMGDTVVIDFDGSVDGEKLPGMKGEAYSLRLGSGQFIPGFEDQLVGVKAGESRTVNVTFPEDYGHDKLSGKDAVFEVDVKQLREDATPEVTEELAKDFGVESLDKLKEMVRDRLKRDYSDLGRLRVKRQLLDKLAEGHSFEVPQGMVEVEFEAIWKRLQDELARGQGGEDADKPEEELKAEYRSIAERRVRLGLLLSEIGRRNNIQVSQDELNRAVLTEARRFPGQERQVFEFFRSNPEAIENLRAPLFEDKVVDFILELAKVTERTVTVEELMRDPDEAEEKAA